MIVCFIKLDWLVFKNQTNSLKANYKICRGKVLNERIPVNKEISDNAQIGKIKLSSKYPCFSLNRYQLGKDKFPLKPKIFLSHQPF